MSLTVRKLLVRVAAPVVILAALAATAGTVYASMAPPKYFVSLLGAGHAPAYEDTPDPHDGVVIAATLDFWNLYLKAQDAARAHLLTDANHPPLSSIRSAP